MAITDIELSGYIFQDDGDAVNGATVAILETGTTTQEDSTTTNSDGLWTFTETSDDTTYDVKVTSGSSVRKMMWADEIALKGVDTSYLKIRGANNAAAPLYFFADRGDENIDVWRINAANGGVLTFDNRASGSSDSDLTAQLTITPHATAASSVVAVAGNLTVGGDLTISGDDLTMGTNTSTAILVADGTNYNPVVPSGVIDLANNGAFTLDNTVISSQTEITSGLAAADELLYSDGGTVKKVGLDNFIELAPTLATEDAIANGDYILFLDGGATGNMNKEAVADFATLLAGTGISASASVLSIDAAQTGITSIYATDLIMGEDSQTAIDFGTANEIDFKVDNAARLTLTASALYPVTDNQIDLGTSSLEFKDAFFDGTVTADAFAGPLTGNVTGTADVATVATTVTITDNESTNESNAIIFTAGGDVDGGNLGLESDGTLTYNPSTGKITATGFIGALTGNVTGDVTGDVTGTADTATVATTVTITDNESTNETNAVIFTAGAAKTGGNLGLESDGDLTYNPSSGTLAATAFTGALTGNVTGNTSGTAATVTGAAQSAITSLGTLTTLTVDNVIVNGTTIGHTDDTDLLTVADAALTLKGTLTVGVDDTGHDVKFFGASAGAYMEWDESADQLRIMGASADATTSTGKLLLATSLTDINANDVIGKIDFQAPHEAGGTDAITVAASIQAIAQGTFSSSVNATDLIFYTGHSEAATEKVRITSQGEIGIGGANYGSDGQVLTSAGAGAAVAWEDAGGGGVAQLAGKDTSEGSTTSNSSTELCAVTNLDIHKEHPIDAVVGMRGSGAGTTYMRFRRLDVGDNGQDGLEWVSNSWLNVGNGFVRMYMGPRDTNYTHGWASGWQVLEPGGSSRPFGPDTNPAHNESGPEDGAVAEIVFKARTSAGTIYAKDLIVIYYDVGTTAVPNSSG